MSIQVKVRIIKFWCNLFDTTREKKISSMLYKLLYIDNNNYGIENKWLSFITGILDNCGMSNIWQHQNYISKQWIVQSIEQKLKDQFRQEWSAEMNQLSKGLCCILFKNELKFEKYLSILSLNCALKLC